MRKQTINRAVVIGIGICLTATILWFSKGGQVEETERTDSFALVEVEPEESIWGKMVPKSITEQKNDRRLALQSELALLIEGLQGVSTAQVVLSLQESKGLGHRYIPTTACVTITPASHTELTTAEIKTITRLVSSGVAGLHEEDVTIVDNRDGLICTGQDIPILPKQMNQATIRTNVEEALGLKVATVNVEMISPPEGELFIPWLDNKKPVVRLTLPRSWVTWRAEEVGDVQTVLENISHIAQTAAAGSFVEISIIHDNVAYPGDAGTVESSSKQWAMVCGLFALLLSGMTVRRRKREIGENQEPNRNVQQEAQYILSLHHQDAKVAIDSLQGSRRRYVLEAIAQSEVVPIIEVPARCSASSVMVECG
ncbi:MAG: hypothetical protein QGI78_08365 [Phycisphaerales bacterium]|jgi:hypothetical protein|nr:hypothetical protein [Phycisphaerales bacterium]